MYEKRMLCWMMEGYKVRKVPENNSYKKEIEEIVMLCEKAIPEYVERNNSNA